MIEIKNRYTNEVIRTVDATNLRGAYLRGADLGGADLGGADLRGADLRGAYLGGAYLGGAYLGDADLRGADLGGADLRDAYLRGADLGGADLGDAIDVLPDLGNVDAMMLTAIEASQAAGHAGMDMSTWHRCETTHCRAGWAIHLSGPAGAMLEALVGPSVAGALIYAKHGRARVPDWHASNEDAMADISAGAAA